MRAVYRRNLDSATPGFHVEAIGASAHASIRRWLLKHVISLTQTYQKSSKPSSSQPCQNEKSLNLASPFRLCLC